MRTLQQVLEQMDKADLFFGVKVDSVHTERFSGETALHIYAKWGGEEAVRILVDAGASIDKPGEDNNTPLHYAAMLGKFEAAKCLVELGAKCSRDRYGNTPSQLATDSDELRSYLAQNGF